MRGGNIELPDGRIMYLSGSKWNMRKKRRRRNPWRILLLLVLIAGGIYLWRFYVPTVPPLFVPTPTPTRSPASYVLEAESLFQSGKLEQAETSYLEAVEVDPREPDHYIQLARVRMFAGDYAGAETAARDALVLDPENGLAHAILAWSLDFQAGEAEDVETQSAKLSEAVQSIDRALSLNPNSALVNAYAAEIIIDNRDRDFTEQLHHGTTSCPGICMGADRQSGAGARILPGCKPDQSLYPSSAYRHREHATCPRRSGRGDRELPHGGIPLAHQC
jgi:tetratricopeptide (TPR) repeat protein